MFGASPKNLNKLQASGLIQRILEEHASKKSMEENRSRR
jgi:hypothetical protein